MTDHDASDRSPSYLEREAERVRADIANTAEHLKDKLSPGQLMDQVVDYLKEGEANQLLSNLKTQVRDNPLALGLVAGGLAWLMMGSGSGALAHRSPATPGMAPTEAMRDRGASVASSVGDAATSATEAMSATAHDLRDAAGDYMASASQAGADAGARIRSTSMDVFEREPLVLGALGVAVGAAIGALIPPTRTEQDYLGDASRQARKSAESAIAEGVEKAKHVASDVYEAAKAEADRQGLLPGDRPLADKVSDVAIPVGNEFKGAADERLNQARDAADQKTEQLSSGEKTS